MAYEQRDLSFSLFRNDRKERDRQPDYTGTLMVNGKRYRLAGWWKTTRGGDNYLSGKLEPIE